MKKRELQSILQNGPQPKRLKETQQICTTILNQQKQLNLIPEERTKFWQFLSDVMRHIGWRLWLSQGIVLLFICAGVFSILNVPNVISMFIPLLILACLPSFYQSSIFGMGEIEAVTRASGAQIILAKLILAGAAQIICLTVICWLAHYVCHRSVFRMFNIDTLEYEEKRTVRNTMWYCIMLRSKRFCRYTCTLAPCYL